MVKGGRLLFEAASLEPHQIWPWLAILLGLSLGSLKAQFLFRPKCHKNLARIGALEQPKIWQVFSPKFLVFLLLMIITGATLSQWAHNNYPFLIVVAILDLSIAIALLGSSNFFRIHKK